MIATPRTRFSTSTADIDIRDRRQRQTTRTTAPTATKSRNNDAETTMLNKEKKVKKLHPQLLAIIQMTAVLKNA
jgi:hypothetical protein